MAAEAEFHPKLVVTIRSNSAGTVQELRRILRQKLHAQVLEAMELKVREIVDADPDLEGVDVYYKPVERGDSIRRPYDDPVAVRR